MARPKGLEKMSYAELTALELQIGRVKANKQNAARAALRQEISTIAKEHGFDIGELFGKTGRSKKSVAVKYRDPKNANNTWTGRGRMPSWMVAATKGGRARKEDFLVK
jgi:DNA-binding protein H-NS